MKFVLAQVNPVVGHVTHNAAIITDAWARHHDACDLIIFPELVLSGYPLEDLVLKPAFLDAIERAVDNICAVVKGGAAVLISAPWRIDGQIYNALLLIDGGRVVAVTPKHHLPNYGVFDEKRVFAAGGIPSPILFRGCKLGLMTCEDMWHADVASALKTQGAEILIVANGSPYEMGKTEKRLNLAHARVTATNLPLLYLNLIGGQDEIVFDGASFGVNADGVLAFRMKAFAPDETCVTFENSVLLAHKNEIWPQGLESIYEALKLGMCDYVLKNGFTRVLIGLSGGIDSALVAALAVEALGAANVSCIMMPSPYTAQISLDDAAALAQNLGCDYRVIPIQTGMNAFDIMLGDDAHKGVTPENIQSRLRGMLLMALSNTTGALVLSTGNKSEMAVGYATLYGDMCGGFAPLKDVYKTDVFALCRWLNARDVKPLIPERIITRPPSAELKPDQTDQDTLPPYDVLDAILKGFIEGDTAVLDTPLAQRVWRMLHRAEYKRQQAPPGVKITSRAFGRDRRYPLTNGFCHQTLEKSE
jgi:NAD+ synthase